MLLAILGYVVVGPVMSGILTVLAAGVNILVSHSLLPLVTIFIEPAKVLFLNNAINHGIFTPLATAQAAEAGKSIMYMLEPNPGPGLGVLLAYMFFCKDKKTKQSAPGAVIIHVLGGIHEIYFPYILMNPLVKSLQECTPDAVSVLDDGRELYDFILDQNDDETNSIVFYSTHQEIVVYADGKLIYQLDAVPGIWGNTPGWTWNIVRFSSNVSSLQVQFTPCYPETAGQQKTF